MQLRLWPALLALPLMAQLSTITDALKSPIDNVDFTGTIDIEAAPACKVTRGGVSYGQMKRRYCLGVTGSACNVSTAAGVLSMQLVPNDAGTLPTGCYYTARYTPTTGTAYSETWFVTASTPVKIKDVRTSIVPSPSALVKAAQIDASALSAGCAYVDNGVVKSTGIGCTSASPIPLYQSAAQSGSCLTVPAATHGFTNGGLAAWAVDLGTGETLRPSVSIDGSNNLTACFATAPASWQLLIAGTTGSGLTKFPLTSGDVTVLATSHGIYSLTGLGFCYDSAGAEFDCLVTFNPSTFAARIQHTPFSAGSYVVLIGR